jgi:hypothetical protein
MAIFIQHNNNQFINKNIEIQFIFHYNSFKGCKNTILNKNNLSQIFTQYFVTSFSSSEIDHMSIVNTMLYQT